MAGGSIGLHNLLMIEIPSDFRYQKARSHGSIVCIG